MSRSKASSPTAIGQSVLHIGLTLDIQPISTHDDEPFHETSWLFYLAFIID
jgi:hypothetical protein